MSDEWSLQAPTGDESSFTARGGNKYISINTLAVFSVSMGFGTLLTGDSKVCVAPKNNNCCLKEMYIRLIHIFSGVGTVAEYVYLRYQHANHFASLYTNMDLLIASTLNCISFLNSCFLSVSTKSCLFKNAWRICLVTQVSNWLLESSEGLLCTGRGTGVWGQEQGQQDRVWLTRVQSLVLEKGECSSTSDGSITRVRQKSVECQTSL